MGNLFQVNKLLTSEPAPLPEQKLWRAVLNQALEDVFGMHTVQMCDYEKHEVEHYFTKRTEDFDRLCEDAGVNATQLWKKVQRLKMIRIGFLRPNNQKEKNTLCMIQTSQIKRKNLASKHWRHHER